MATAARAGPRQCAGEPQFLGGRESREPSRLRARQLRARRAGCDVLPVRISGTYKVLGKGSIIPHRHPVEVRIGRVITNAELRALADNAEGTGAYRKLADAMRAAVLALGERVPTSSAAVR